MTRIRALVVVVVAACGSGATAGSGSGSSSGSGSAAPWHDDLQFLVASLARHKSEFFKVAEADFRRAVAALDAKLPSLDDAHIEVGFLRLAAMIGDSHTRVFLRRDRLYPVRFLGFEDGIFVAGADRDAAWAVGKKVVALDGRPIADVLAAVTPLVAWENADYLAGQLPALLEDPVALTGLDLAHGDRLKITVADGTATRDLDVVAGHGVALTPPKALPLHLQGPTQLDYWNKYVPDQKLLYLQYNACANDDRVGPFDKFAEATLAYADQHPVERFVIDLRNNTGGNSKIIEPLVDGLVKRKIPVFALIGRTTFSSGVLAAIDLAERAHATLVGTPTGGSPNAYGEIKTFELPRSHLVGQYSTKLFADPHYKTTVPPALAVHVTGDDWFSGRDPAIDAVLAAKQP